MQFLKETFASELEGYNGDNIQYIIETVRLSRRSGDDNEDPGSWWLGTVRPPPEFDSSEVTWFDDDNFRETTKGSTGTGSSFATTRHGELRWEPTRWSWTEAQRETTNVIPGSGQPDSPFPVEGDWNKTSAEPEVESLSYEVHLNSEEAAAAYWVDGPTMLRRDLPLPPVEMAATVKSSWNETADYYFRRYSYADRLLKIAHIFHFASIAILGIFVIQVNQVISLDSEEI